MIAVALLALAAGCSSRASVDAQRASEPAVVGVAGDDPACIQLRETAEPMVLKYEQALAEIEEMKDKRAANGQTDYAFENQMEVRASVLQIDLFFSVTGSLQDIWPFAGNPDLKSTMKALARYGNSRDSIQASIGQDPTDYEFHLAALAALCPIEGVPALS